MTACCAGVLALADGTARYRSLRIPHLTACAWSWARASNMARVA